MTDPSPKALLEQAQSQVQTGNVAAAIDLYRRIPKTSAHAKKAQRALKSLQKSNPGAVMEADLTALIALHEQQSRNQAMSLARRLSRSYPQQPLPHNIMGTIHMARQQYAEAAKCFRRALELAPDFLDARNNLGAACNSLEDYAQAINCFGQVIAAQPGDAEAHANLGNAYRRSGKLDLAVGSYENSLRIRPGDVPTLLNLGQTLMEMRLPNQAMLSYHNALELEPDRADIMRYTADAFREMSQYDQAMDWYKRAIERAPQESRSHTELGMLYLQLDRAEEAAAELQTALELAPGSAEIQHFLAAAQGDSSTTAPAAYVASLFDNYAARFDEHLVKSLSYDAPRLLHQLASDSGALGSGVHRAIDLGCGTGLCGAEFHGNCAHLTGVDLAEKMITQARDKGLYDQLVQGDIVETLTELDQTFDLFISADTFIYVGDLAAVFEAVAAHADPGALFIFSTESGYRQDVELLGSGRYAHSNAYIHRLAQDKGFEVTSYREQNLRKERTEWLQGGYYLLEYRG